MQKYTMKNVRRFARNTLTIVILASQLMSSAQAATYNIPFDNAGDYSFDNLRIEVANGLARLIPTVYKDDEPVGEFQAGTGADTSWNGVDAISLTAPYVTSVGTFLSRVFDSTNLAKEWNSISWVPNYAYEKDLPNNGGVETGYGKYNADMTDNALLLHGDEQAGAVTFDDASGNNNAGTCTNCPSTVPGVFGNALSFDGTNDAVTIADSGSLDLSGEASFEAWVGHDTKETFTYKREVAISPTTTVDGVQVKVSLNNTFSYGNLANADGDDIRFTDEHGYNLPYWIEDWNNGANSTLWVRTRSRGTSKVFMHYGNATVEQGSNGYDTFIFFDDFDRSQYDGNSWTLAQRVSNGGFTTDGDRLHMEVDSSAYNAYAAGGPGYSDVIKTQKEFFEDDIIVESLVDVTSIGYEWSGAYVRLGLHRVGALGTDFFGWYTPGFTHVYLAPQGGAIGGGSPVDSEVQLGITRLKVFYSDTRMRAIGEGAANFDVTANTASANTQGPWHFQMIGGGGKGNAWDMKHFFARKNDAAASDGDFSTVLQGETSVASELVYIPETFRFERSIALAPATPEDDFQVKLTLDSSFPYANLLEDARDMQIFDASNTPVPFWIEDWNNAGNSLIWVKVPTAGTDSLVMRYGNDSAVSTASGKDTFDLFDDFYGTALDASTWSIKSNNKVIDVKDGVLKLERGGGGGGSVLETVEDFTGYKVMKAKMFNAEAQANSAYYTCYSYGTDSAYSAIGYANFNSAYRSALFSGDNTSTSVQCPPWTVNNTIMIGDVITDVHYYPDYFDEEFVIPDGKIAHSQDGKPYETSTNFDGVNAGKVTISAYDSAQMLSKIDYIYLRKWSATEPVAVIGDETDLTPHVFSRDGVTSLQFSGSKVIAEIAGSVVKGYLNNDKLTHVVASKADDYNAAYIGGIYERSHWSKAALPAVQTSALILGGLTSSNLFSSFIIDELAIYDKALTAADALGHYLRGGVDLGLQLRSCDDALCDTEGFQGPDGTDASYFREKSNDTLSPKSYSTPTTGVNRYAQYRGEFTGDGVFSPEVTAVEVLPSTYPDSNPLLTPSTTQAYATLASVQETRGANTTGTLEYQVTNNGTNWYYWDATTSQWVAETGGGYPTETSPISEVSANISFFPSQVGTGVFNIRGFLASNGSQAVELDNIEVTYGLTDTAPNDPSTPFMNTAVSGAQSGEVNPSALASVNNLVVSAVYEDDDIGDIAVSYRLEVSEDPDFLSAGDVYSSGLVNFSTPVHQGARTPDIALPNDTFSYDTVYYWRVLFVDAVGNLGAYTPSGIANASSFTIVDAGLPVTVSTAPADVSVNVPINTAISFVVRDTGTGVDDASINVQISGVDAIINGVCQAGYTCSITATTATDTEVVVTPDTSLAYGSTIPVTYQVKDSGSSANTLSASFSFTTVSAPVIPPVSGGTGTSGNTGIFGGGGGGFSAQPKTNTNTTPTTTENSGNSNGNSQSISTESMQKSLTDFDKALLIYAPDFEKFVKNLSATTTSITKTLLGSLHSGTQRASAPEVNTDPRAPLGPIAYENSLCPMMATQQSVSIAPGASGVVQGYLDLLAASGVRFTADSGALDVSSTVSRSDLLKYLLQLECRQFDGDISGVPTFADVLVTHPNYLYVHTARKYGYVTGYLNDGLYHPDQSVTRAEALKIVLEFYFGGRGIYLDAGVESFDDVQPDDWFGRYIRYASGEGLLPGNTSGPYRPNEASDLLSVVEQIATVLLQRQ